MKADLIDDEGNVVACLRYEPDKPLSCGAHVWLETNLKVRLNNGKTVS